MTLTSGEKAEVEVLEMELGKEVRVRLSGGTEKTIPWAWVASVELHPQALPAEPTSAPAAPAATSAATAGTAAATSAPPEKKPEPTRKERIEEIEDEIERIHKEDMPSVGGPITLTVSGLATGAYMIVLAAGLGGTCSTTTDEDACQATSTAFGVVGGVATAAGIGGVVWLASRVKARKPHFAKIHELEAERDRLKVDVQAGPTGGFGTLTWSF